MEPEAPISAFKCRVTHTFAEPEPEIEISAFSVSKSVVFISPEPETSAIIFLAFPVAEKSAEPDTSTFRVFTVISRAVILPLPEISIDIESLGILNDEMVLVSEPNVCNFIKEGIVIKTLRRVGDMLYLYPDLKLMLRVVPVSDISK